MAIVDASYTNLVPAFGGGYSYAFDGQWGSLDHALANASLRSQVTSARDWFINADEPTVLDYNTNFKSPGQVLSLYAPDRFRMSDHNPLAVDLDLISPLDTSASVNGAGSWCWEHREGRRLAIPDPPPASWSTSSSRRTPQPPTATPR